MWKNVQFGKSGCQNKHGNKNHKVNHPFLFLCWSHVFLSFGPFGTASITAEPQSLATGEPQSLAILDMEGKRYHNLSKILPGKSLFVCFDIAHRHFQEPDLKYVYVYVYAYVYVYVYAYVHVYVYAYVYVYVCVNIYIHIYIHIYTYIYAYIYIYTHIYIHTIYIHTCM